MRIRRNVDFTCKENASMGMNVDSVMILSNVIYLGMLNHILINYWMPSKIKVTPTKPNKSFI